MEVCKGFVSQTLHEVFSVFAKALYVFKCSVGGFRVGIQGLRARRKD